MTKTSASINCNPGPSKILVAFALCDVAVRGFTVSLYLEFSPLH